MQQFRLNCLFIYGLKCFIISERKKIFENELRTSIPWNRDKCPSKNILYNLPFCGIVNVWLYAFYSPPFYPRFFTLRLFTLHLSNVNPKKECCFECKPKM